MKNLLVTSVCVFSLGGQLGMAGHRPLPATESSSAAALETINNITSDSSHNFTINPGSGTVIMPGINSITIKSSIESPEGVAQFVVSPISGQTGYSDIQLAIDDAYAIASSSTPQTVWIWPGSYTADLILYPWVNLAAASDPSSGSGVLIVGSAAYADSQTGYFSITNIAFQSAGSAPALSFESSLTSVVDIQSCYINSSASTALECTGSGMTVNVKNSLIAAGSGANAINIANGLMQLLDCRVASALFAASTISGGSLRVIGGYITDSYDVGSTASIAIFDANIDTKSALPALNLQTGASGLLSNCTISSMGTYAVEGTGSLSYGIITCVTNLLLEYPGLTLIPLYPISAPLSFDQGSTFFDPTSLTSGEVVLGTGDSTLSSVPRVNDGVLITDDTGIPFWLPNSSTSGYVLTVNVDGPPSWQVSSTVGGVTRIDGNSGFARAVDGIITIGGGSTGLTTEASGSALELTGTLNLASGGTSASLTASNGGIFYSTDLAGAILEGIATANHVLLSGESGAPSWSTVKYPSTTTANNILYSSSTNTVGQIATANNGTLITSGSGVPSISSTLPAAVQANITGLGTVTVGTWEGTIIEGEYGGTGALNTGLTIDLSSGVEGYVLTSDASGNAVWEENPGIGTLTTLTGDSGSATSTSGVITISGDSTGLTIEASGSTMELTGTLNLASGGTNASLTASNGGIFYSTGSAGAILPATATARQALLSGTSGAPSWGTATYPSTTTANNILYSSASNVVGQITTANNGVLITSGSGVPSISSTLPTAVQTNITGLGTVTTGTWEGTVIEGEYGGTGVANTGLTIDLASGAEGYVLTSDTSGNATWQSVSESGAVTTITGNSGGAETPSSGNFNIVGTGSITTVGSANTETIQLTGLTNHAVLVGAGSATITKVGPSSTTGQILQSAGPAADPAFSTATYPATTTANRILYSSASNVVGQIVTANNGVIVTSGSGAPSIGSTLPTAVQTNITGLGTVTVGTWEGTIIEGEYGGTGALNTGLTIDLSSGVEGYVLTSDASGNAVWEENPITGIITTIDSDSGSATPTSGAVTISGGSTGLTTEASDSTVELTGTLNLASGGTNASLTASNGGVFYSTGTAGAILTGTATARQALLSGASGAPAWGAATYPPTTTANNILYSSASNVVGQITTANNGVLITSGSGVPSISSTLPTAVQTNITRLGTVAVGTWEGTVIEGEYGGTGIANTGLTIDLSSGAEGYVLTSDTSGNAAWQSVSESGAITTITGNSGGAETPSSGNFNIVGTGSITSVGSANTETIQLTGLTNHAVLVGAGSTTITKVGPSSTIGQALQSTGASADPAFSTATYPSTTTANNILYSSASNVVGQIATANNGVLVTSASGIPSILPNSSTAGFVLTANSSAPPSWQISSTEGTVTTIDGDSGSAAPTAGLVTIDGGSTGLTTSASGSTVELTGTLNLASGGTNASLTASNGGIFYSTGSAGAILAGTATASQALLSGASGAPSWGTATYPTTTTANNILYSSSDNVVGQISTTDNGVLITSASGVPLVLPNASHAGFVLTASGSKPPSWKVPATVGGVTAIDGDSGSAEPTDGVITIDGGSTGLTTEASVSTVELTGTLNLASGGTNASLTASNGGIFYSTADAGAILSGTATGSQVLLSGSSGAPSWSTATYPSTTTVKNILYSSSDDSIGEIVTETKGVLITSASGVPSILHASTSGFVLTANDGAPPSWQVQSTVGGVTEIDGDSGVAVATDGVVTISGGSTGLTTSASGFAMELTGTLNLASGGTNASLTASDGGIFYSTTDAGAILAGTATAQQLLLSGASGAPSWSTATYPSTTTANNILYSSASNVVGQISTTDNGVLITSATGVPSMLPNSSTAGYVLAANSGGPPSWQVPSTIDGIITITGDSGSATPTSGAVTISGGSTGLTTEASDSAMELTGTLNLTSGGTNASLTASNGGVFYSTGTAGAILSGTATARQVLLSGASGAPSWGTATYPSTTTANNILYSSASNVVGQITTANNGTLITSGSGVPSISSTLPTAVQTNITQLGTVTAGTWEGSIIEGEYGGTGIANTGLTIDLASGAEGYVLTSDTSGNATWKENPATGALTTIDGNSGSATPTNGIITIDGGSTGLTTEASDSTMELTGTLNLASGGTNASLTASNGGIFYSTGSAGAILAGTATARQPLLSGASGAPSWGTATYPSTTTANNILYSSATNVVGQVVAANNGTLITSASGVPSISSTLPTAVQTNITGLGTVTAGAWEAAVIEGEYGGAGIANTGLTIDLSSGVEGYILTSDASGNATWEENLGIGTLTTLTGDSGSATSTSGTITISGGSTGLTTSASGSTMELTGTLNLASGGTNASLTASNGGIFYSTGSAGAILSGTATARQPLLSGASGAPAWGTATYPSTTTANNILYSSASNVVGQIATAGNGVLITSGSGVPSISSTLPTAVQTNITRLGTVAAGTWESAIIEGEYGGTGIANTGLTIDLTSGAEGYVLTSDTSGNATWQSISGAGAVTTIAGDSGSATSTSGVITINGGSTGLTTSASDSIMELTGTLNLASGGTNASLTASNGGILYSTGSAGAVLAGTATARQPLLSGASGAPSWGTATYPSTTTANNILYSSATNAVGQITTANNGTLITSGSGVPSISSTLPAAVQTNITGLGTVTAGTWESAIIEGEYGGTGIANTGLTIDLASGAEGYVLTSDTSGNATWQPTSELGAVTTITGNSGGAEAPSSGNFNIVGTGSITTVGTANTETIQLTGLTNHAVLVGAGSSTITKVGPSSTAGQILQSAGSSANPAFSTATYPSTTTANNILYSSSSNVVGQITTANNGVIVTSGSGVPSISSTLPSAVQTNITGLGTVTAGTWEGTAIEGEYGGAGVANTGLTIDLASGVEGHILTSDVDGNATWQSVLESGAVTTITGNSGGAETPSSGNFNIVGTGSITSVGSANTETIQLTGLTNHAVLVGAGSATITKVGPSSTAGQILQSGGSSANPAFSTATYPSTTTANNILYSLAENVVGQITTGNNGVLVTSETGAPSISSTLPVAVQTNITEIGTVTVGTWEGTPIEGEYGGTGVANAGITIDLSFEAEGYVLRSDANGNATWQEFPIAEIVTAIDGDSGSAEATDGVITINGGSTGLTTSASGSTVDLTGTLNLASGGTNASLTASNGGVFYSTGSAGAILAGTATASQVLLSGASSAPSWGAATYPSTTTANNILYSSATNVVGQITTANNGVLITSASGVPSVLPTTSSTAGYVLTANSGAPPSWKSEVILEVGDVVSGEAFNGTQGTTLTSTASGFTLQVAAQNPDSTTYGGTVTIISGVPGMSTTGGQGGNVNIIGAAGFGAKEGGTINITGGAGSFGGLGGQVTISGGEGGAAGVSSSGTGGIMQIISGDANASSTNVQAGEVIFQAGLGTGTALSSLIRVLGTPYNPLGSTSLPSSVGRMVTNITIPLINSTPSNIIQWSPFDAETGTDIASGSVIYAIEAGSSTNNQWQTCTGRVNFVSVANASTDIISGATGSVGTELSTGTSGSLSSSWGFTTQDETGYLTCTPTSSGLTGLDYLVMYYTLISNCRTQLSLEGYLTGR